MTNKRNANWKRWPKYTPGQKNTIVLVISDACIEGSDRIIDKEQPPTKGEEFFDKLFEFLRTSGFEAESFGDKAAMIDKFFKGSGQKCYTEKVLIP